MKKISRFIAVLFAVLITLSGTIFLFLGCSDRQSDDDLQPGGSQQPGDDETPISVSIESLKSCFDVVENSGKISLDVAVKSVKQATSYSSSTNSSYTLDLTEETGTITTSSSKRYYYEGYSLSGNGMGYPYAWDIFAPSLYSTYDFTGAVATELNGIITVTFASATPFSSQLFGLFEHNVYRNAVLELQKGSDGGWTHQRIFADAYRNQSHDEVIDIEIELTGCGSSVDVYIRPTIIDTIRAGKEDTSPKSYVYPVEYPHSKTHYSFELECLNETSYGDVPVFDGNVLTAHRFYSDDYFLYDEGSDIFVDTTSTVGEINFIDIKTYSIVKTINVPYTNIAVDNGILYISNNLKITTYSISDYTKIAEYTLDTAEYLGAHIISYVHNGHHFQTSWSDTVIAFDNSTKKPVKSFLNHALIDINKDASIIYMFDKTERAIKYIDTATLTVTAKIEVNASSAYDINVIFNGVQLSTDIGQFDAVTGLPVRNSDILKASYDGFIVHRIHLANDKYAAVFGEIGDKGYTAVYDRELEGYIAIENVKLNGGFTEKQFFFFGDTMYMISNHNMVLEFDLSAQTKMLAGNTTEDSVKVDGKKKQLDANYNYMDACTDGKYVYTMSDEAEIAVRDVTTLKTAQIIALGSRPAYFDAYDGMLAVSFNTNKIKVVNTDDWSQRSYDTGDYICSNLFVYDSNIVFLSRQNIMRLDIVSGKVTALRGGFGTATIDINRELGLLYIAEYAISSSDLYYMDLKTTEIVYESIGYTFWYNYNSLQFDGTYLHYYGRMFDANVGIRLKNEEYVKMFAPNAAGVLGTIYFDGKISVYVYEQGGAKYTAVYCLTDSSVTVIDGDYFRATMTDSGILLLAPHSNNIVIIAIQ